MCIIGEADFGKSEIPGYVRTKCCRILALNFKKAISDIAVSIKFALFLRLSGHARSPLEPGFCHITKDVFLHGEAAL